MISAYSRSMEWINQVSALHPTMDKTLIEKTIRAFSLLESLVRSGCPFVFKGGTACMLHLNSSRRLSIDVDIICPPGTDITPYVNQFAEDYGFTHIELVERQSSHHVPKSHAKYFYKVAYVTNKDTETILLDVLFEEIHYGKVVPLPIHSSFLHEEGTPVMVNVPSAADLLGDKLTAFAPHTTGVPFFKAERDCSLEIIKQLFDISSLFEIVPDIEQTIQTFHHFAKVELGYRNLGDITANEVLHDTINTALCITLRGLEHAEEFHLLQRGIKRIGSLIVSKRYTLDDAIRDASRAAYLATLVEKGITTPKRFSDVDIEVLRGMTVNTLHPKLNKLKKSNLEAFYYWALVDGLQ